MKSDLRFVFDTNALVSAVLLTLHPFRGIPILSPRQFLDHDWGKPFK
jgi:hypothetical protein